MPTSLVHVKGYTKANGEKVKGYSYRRKGKSKTAIGKEEYLKRLRKTSREAMKKTGQNKLPRCKPGNIVRNAAVVRGYTRSNGKRVKKGYRRASCIKNEGKRGEEGKGDILVKENVLKKMGYDNVERLSESKRHAALRLAITKESYRRVIAQLVAVANLNIRSNPKLSKIFKADQEYVSGLYREYKKKHGGPQ